METLAYLQIAQDYEAPESNDRVTFNHLGLLNAIGDLKLSNPVMTALIGTTCSAFAVGIAGAAQAIPVAFGDSGGDVDYLQSLLADAGYFSGPFTGFFGELTESAVINFQADNGLAIDGVAGADTFAALEGGFVPISPGGTVGFGDSGSSVSYLQSLLNDNGYFVPVTGFFGGQTESAVIAFQADAGLAVDGVAGPATFAALEGGFVPINPDPGVGILQFGDSGSGVTFLQQQLISLGFLAPGLDTGYFGAATEAALVAYQRSVGLVADGIYGPATAASLV